MKRICLLSYVLCLFVLSSAVAAPPEEGLVLWFGFESDLGDTVKDLSGTGNDGTIVDEVKWTADGKYGGGMEFTNGMISVPNSETLTFKDAITIALWLKSDDVPDAYRRLVGYGWANNGSYILGIDNHWMKMAFAWDIKNTGGTRFDANMDGLVIPGEWHFVTGTYDGEILKLYIDGEVKVQGAANGKINGVADISISQQGLGAGGGSFVGTMDEVRLYNRALSDEEVQQAMEAPGGSAVSVEDKLTTVWGSIKEM